MSSRDKGLIAILSSMVVILVVAIVLAVDIYNDSANGSNYVEYVTGTTIANNQPADNTTSYFTNETTTLLFAETTTYHNYNNETTTRAENSTSSQVQETTTVKNTSVNASAMTKSEILTILTNAVNKTKAYTGAVTVKHVESFNANVTECTGGSLVVTAANALVGMVLDPTDETLSFSGGTAQNSEGETVTILLPQKGNFTLPMSGIKSISASANGNETVINVTLVEESVGMYDKPAYNAAGVGILDVSTLDLSILEITSADIVYTGSTIEAHIRPDGYISYAKYTIPMHIEGAAKSGVISGSAVFDGMQTETWQFNW